MLGAFTRVAFHQKITRRYAMNWDQIQGNWMQVKGKVKQQWGKLTDDDIARINGKQEELLGLLQQRYGYAKEQAQKEVDNWIRMQKSIAA
jgi:uncharacterized protein YjbJ (UPF0337 family)